MGELTIKARLINRFVSARSVLGTDWRKKLAESDPLYNTVPGYTILNRVAGAVSKDSRAGVDHIESVVIAMEKIILSYREKQPQEA